VVEKKRVIEAVTKLGGKVTAADVTLETGLSPDVVTLTLNTIAWETGGRLEVSDQGVIAYSFSTDFTGKYFARGLRLFLERTQQRALEVGSLLIRLSLGAGLLLSIGVMLLVGAPVVVFSIIVAEYQELTEVDGPNEASGKKGSGSKKKKSAKKSGQPAAPRRKLTNAERMERISRQFDALKEFSAKCYSHIFGEGDPNKNIEDTKWRIIARLIREREYAVTVEELSPYTGNKPEDENGALPVLVHFNGKPEVADSGNIIYVFPSLQTVIADDKQEDLPPYLEEAKWVESRYSDKQLYQVRQLGLVNLVGSWGLWIWNRTDGYHLPVIFDVICVYGNAFLLYPLARYMLREKRNTQISLRNEARESYAQRLERPTSELKAKLLDASQFKLKETHIASRDIVYATDKASLDQPDELDAKFK
jgi:hypothetical protein